jgi:phosphoserine phosphatase
MLPALEWRLDQLTDVERRVLEAASHIGVVFGASDLTPIAREPEDVVTDVLERLLVTGGLIVRATRRGPAIPADRYRFAHSLSPRLLMLRGSSTADLRRAHRLFPPRGERPRPSAA